MSRGGSSCGFGAHPNWPEGEREKSGVVVDGAVGEQRDGDGDNGSASEERQPKLEGGAVVIEKAAEHMPGGKEELGKHSGGFCILFGVCVWLESVTRCSSSGVLGGGGG